VRVRLSDVDFRLVEAVEVDHDRFLGGAGDDDDGFAVFRRLIRRRRWR
jgi:hypothetical protein